MTRLFAFVVGGSWGNDIDGGATTDVSVVDIETLRLKVAERVANAIQYHRQAVEQINAKPSPKDKIWLDALTHHQERLAKLESSSPSSLLSWAERAEPGFWFCEQADSMYKADVYWFCVRSQDPMWDTPV